MPIFSSNRVSYGESVVADKTYTEHDMGRIMQECAINDMKIFNAALARDFKEVEGQREGTMLESELQAFQEFSIKEAWKSLKEKVKKLWAKIKGVFKNVYAKLTVALVRDNKTFIAMHRKELLSKDCSNCKIPKFRDTKSGVKADVIAYDSSYGENLKKALEAIEKLDPASPDFETTLKNNSGSEGRDENITADSLFKNFMEKCFEDTNSDLTFGKCNAYGGSVNALLNNLSTNSGSLKGIKEQSKKIDKKFKTLLGKIEKAQQKADKDKDTEASKTYTNANKMVTFAQKVLNADVSSAIRACKFMIKNDRGLVGTLVAYNPKAKNETAYLESAYMEGFDRLFMETDDMDPEDVEAAAEEEGVNIEISVDGDADVTVDDNTDDE